MKTFKEFINEDGVAAAVAGPANAVGSGAIAGTGGKGGEPGVNLKKKKNPPYDYRVMGLTSRNPPK
jgi:hypothetical protein